MSASDHPRSTRDQRAWDAAVVSAQLGSSRLGHLATAAERHYPEGHPQRAEADRARSYAAQKLDWQCGYCGDTHPDAVQVCPDFDGVVALA